MTLSSVQKENDIRNKKVFSLIAIQHLIYNFTKAKAALLSLLTSYKLQYQHWLQYKQCNNLFNRRLILNNNDITNRDSIYDTSIATNTLF